MIGRNVIALSNGKLHDLANPWAGEPDIEVIAHSLANTCRWNGHTKRFYSVAEHSLRVCSLVGKEHKLAALLHDAAEAYIGDVVKPLELMLGVNWLQIKRDHDRWVYNSLISSRAYQGWGPEVDYADHVLLATEARDLLGIHIENLPPPLESVIAMGQPYDMATLFIKRFKELTA